MDNSICAVVVTQNRPVLLAECINSLLPQVNHIVIFDNDGTNETKEYLNSIKKNKKIIIEHSNVNLGGAGGFSNGLSIGMKKTDDEYFWIMDDDTIPKKDSSENLFKAAIKLNNNFGFLCSDVRLENGKHVNIPVVNDDWCEKIDDNLVRVNVATFVSLFLKRDNILKVGLPISEMFIWGDDTEYTNRLSNLYNCYFVVKSNVIHKTKATLPNINIFNDERIGRYFYKTRNIMFCCRKYDKKSKVIIMFLKNTITAFEALVKSKNHRFKRCYVILKGNFEGLFFNPTIKY